MTRVNTLKDIEAIYLESIQSINEGGGDPSSVSAALLDDEDVDHYKQTGEIRKKETPRLRDRLKDKIQKLSTSKNISAMSKAGNNYDQFSLGTFEERSPGNKVAKEGNKGTKADRELADTDNDGKLADWEKAKTNAIRKAQNKSHLCAKTVNHENYGPGGTVHGQHAIPDVNGDIEWYMVEFKHGTEKIMTEDLEVVFAVEHNHN